MSLAAPRRKVLLAFIVKLCDTGDMNLTVDTDLRERLIRLRGQWPRIAESADVSHSWLSQFARDKIPNPGLSTLRKLAKAMDALAAEAKAA